MAENRQKTVNRDDDGRLQRGARLLFDRETEREALIAARLLKRLRPEFQQCVRFCAEAFLEEQQRERPVADLDPDAVVRAFAALAPIAARVKTLPIEHRLDLLRQVQAELAADKKVGA
jgi:hypothetical protein